MTTERVYAIALANDDPHPDDVCPGCGADITGWRRYEAHYPPGAMPRYRVMNGLGQFVDDGRGAPKTCPWSRDYLVARVWRRRLIAEGVTR